MAAEVWDRFTVHYTPTHGSWLNQAEIEIGIFTRQCLGKRRIADLKTLRREARAWNRRMNHDRVKITWKFDRKRARQKFHYKKKLFKRSQTWLRARICWNAGYGNAVSELPSVHRGNRRSDGSAIFSQTSSCGFFTGSIRNRTASINVKIAVFAPIPSANKSRATAVNPGVLPKRRRP
jgi:hypothetical protein